MPLSNKKEKFLKILVFVGLLTLIIVIFSQKIEFTAVDLGRHLENGRLLWSEPELLFKNFYSYSEADHPFVNHHWLSGLIFYGIYLLGGFKLLSIFNALVVLMAFILAFGLARKKAGFYLSALLSIPVIFLLSQRVEVRPEFFSYLLIFLVWAIIEKVEENKNYRLLWWLAPIFLIWANLHIYFFVGLALLGATVVAHSLPLLLRGYDDLQSLWRRVWQAAKPWVWGLGTAILACLFNPHTWRGLFYPFNIFQSYGYEIAENKSVFYLENLQINPNFSLFKLLLFLLFLSWLAYFILERKASWRPLFFSLLFALLGLLASRNLAIFSLASLVLISANLSWLSPLLKEQIIFWRRYDYEKIRLFGLIFLVVLLVFANVYLFFDASSSYKFIKNARGWGLAAASTDSIEFFRQENLSGPIFNNYDLGSALIFWFPGQKAVFVDNRPEAYSPEFFSRIYRPLQSDPAAWEKYSAQYNFQAIYFSHTDTTPWAQQFLRQRLLDPAWALVYFDPYVVILLKRSEANTAAIKKNALDAWGFRRRLRQLVSDSNRRGQLQLASLAENAKQPDLAEEIYREILRRQPNNALVMAALAYLYSSSSDRSTFLNSFSYFKSALQAGYRLPGVYNQMGLNYWSLGEYKNAESSWRKALKLERGNESAVYYLNQVKQLRLQGKLP